MSFWGLYMFLSMSVWLVFLSVCFRSSGLFKCVWQWGLKSQKQGSGYPAVLQHWLCMVISSLPTLHLFADDLPPRSLSLFSFYVNNLNKT